MPEAATAASWGTAVSRDPSEAAAFALADDVWRLRLPLPYQQVRAVNAYALSCPGGCVLVDCGSSLAPGWAALVHALSIAGFAPDDVRTLVTTHTHSDHFGLAATVVERTGCDLLAHPGEPIAADALRDPIQPEPDRRRRAARAGVPAGQIGEHVGALDGGDGFHARPRPTRALGPGDRVDAGSASWEVVEAPGHARNQIALFDPERRWMISADLALPGVSPYLEHGYGGDPAAEHLLSVRRALALRPTRLLPGHGRPLAPAAPVLESSAAALGDRLSGLARRLEAAARTPYELSLELAGGRAAHPDHRQMALSSTLCDLDHLEREGHARRELGEDGVERFARAEGTAA